MRTRVGRRAGWEIEYRLRRADGAYHWLLERAVPIGAGQSAAGYVGSCTDINARYRESRAAERCSPRSAPSLDRASGVDEQLATLARLTGQHAGWPTPATSVGSATTGGCDRAAVAGLDRDTEAVIATMPDADRHGAARRSGPGRVTVLRAAPARA